MPARPRYPMPDFIREALDEHGVMDAYRARPPTNKMIILAGSPVRNWKLPGKSGSIKCWMNSKVEIFI
jgi:hypothetical protein